MSDKQLILGVFGKSKKENERRVPIHPDHFPEIPKALRDRMVIEFGYGDDFGVGDDELKKWFKDVLPHDAMFNAIDIILMAKPTQADLPDFLDGQILWGWPHCVQQRDITQAGIDKKMTFIAWEAMNQWFGEQQRGQHVFHKNNELAGFCGVQHALTLLGDTGMYGSRKKAAVLHLGSVGRGAVNALKGHGFTDITVFSTTPSYIVPAPVPGVHLRQFEPVSSDSNETQAILDGNKRQPMHAVLAGFDVIVNCVFQDTNHPFMFIRNENIEAMKPGALIVDVSCDEKMGFEFATPTSFADQVVKVGKAITYYAVDHTPSYLFRASSFEISLALLPYLKTVMSGAEAWEDEIIIRKAIEIQDGVIKNQAILDFQNRSKDYPHRIGV